MKSVVGLDFSKLLGFACVDGRVDGEVDFRDESFGARLGAKVGLEPVSPEGASASTRKGD
jgi:hypothetical protein